MYNLCIDIMKQVISCGRLESDNAANKIFALNI